MKGTLWTLLLVLSACGRQEPPQDAVTLENVRKETREAAGAAGTYAEAKRKDYQQGAEARLKALDGRIEELRLRAESSAANAKQDVRRRISDLREKRTAAQLKLDELKSSTRDAWGDLKTGVDRSLEDVEESYKDALSRFK